MLWDYEKYQINPPFSKLPWTWLFIPAIDTLTEVPTFALSALHPHPMLTTVPFSTVMPVKGEPIPRGPSSKSLGKAYRETGGPTDVILLSSRYLTIARLLETCRLAPSSVYGYGCVIVCCFPLGKWTVRGHTGIKHSVWWSAVEWRQLFNLLVDENLLSQEQKGTPKPFSLPTRVHSQSPSSQVTRFWFLTSGITRLSWSVHINPVLGNPVFSYSDTILCSIRDSFSIFGIFECLGMIPILKFASPWWLIKLNVFIDVFLKQFRSSQWKVAACVFITNCACACVGACGVCVCVV